MKPVKEIISSPQNPKIKSLLKLEKSSERKEQNLTVIEGLREISIALQAGCGIEQVFACNDLANSEHIELLHQLGVEERKFIYISKSIFDKIAYRENSDGFIATARPKTLNLENIELGKNPLILVLESVEKPGNLGAILRTADAAQVTAVIVCDPKTDLYNPNVIRSSVGCLFTNQVAVSDSEKTLAWLKANGIKAYAAALTADKFYHETDLSRPCALVMGTEAHGLSDFWLKNSHAGIKIPMRGKIDSLNVATSTAILVFEACRQREFSH